MTLASELGDGVESSPMKVATIKPVEGLNRTAWLREVEFAFPA